MLKTIEIRQTYNDYRTDVVKRFRADDVKVQISGEEVVVFIQGHVVEEE